MSLSILIVLAAAAVFALAVLVVLVMAITNPEAARRRVLALFRRQPRPPRTPGSGHYYKPYWS
jgi:hypothetical protein